MDGVAAVLIACLALPGLFLPAPTVCMAYADCIDELKQAYAEWHWTHQKAKIGVMDHLQQTIVRFRKSSFELYVFSSQRNTHNSTLRKDAALAEAENGV